MPSVARDVALPDREIEVCRADVRLAFQREARRRGGLLGPGADPEGAAELPLDDVLALPDLGRALAFAATRVTAKAASSREIDAKLKLVIELREPMLTLADARRRKRAGETQTGPESPPQ